jgi:cysteine synthase
VIAILCGSGERYRSTILDDVWLAKRRLDISREVDAIRRFFETAILQS